MMCTLPVPDFKKKILEHSNVKIFLAEWIACSHETLTQWRVMPKFAVQILGFKKDIDSEKTIVKIRNWSIRLLYSVYKDILLFFYITSISSDH